MVAKIKIKRNFTGTSIEVKDFNERYRGTGIIYEYIPKHQPKKIYIKSVDHPEIYRGNDFIEIFLKGNMKNKDNIETNKIELTKEEIIDIIDCIKEMNYKLC